MVHHVTLGDAGFEAAEAAAVRRLEELNAPRPGYTGGTMGTVDSGDFRIVQIGDAKSEGLLKSIDAEGKWEGTVYLVPFHTQMAVQDIPAIKTPVEGQTNRYSTGVLSTIKNADQVTSYTLTDTVSPYRYILSNQLYEDGLEVVVTVTDATGGTDMSGITLADISATLQTEKADFYFYNGHSALRNCTAHVGGVSFDVLRCD